MINAYGIFYILVAVGGFMVALVITEAVITFLWDIWERRTSHEPTKHNSPKQRTSANRL